jgi:hypothetical protein
MPYQPTPPRGIVMAEKRRDLPLSSIDAPLQTPQRIGQRKKPPYQPGGVHYIARFYYRNQSSITESTNDPRHGRMTAPFYCPDKAPAKRPQ